MGMFLLSFISSQKELSSVQLSFLRCPFASLPENAFSEWKPLFSVKIPQTRVGIEGFVESKFGIKNVKVFFSLAYTVCSSDVLLQE